MKLSLEDMKIEVSLEEMTEIINERQKHALTDPTMSDGKSQNYLICCMNDGVNLMAKYMKDFFQNAFDSMKYQTDSHGRWG